MPPLPTRFVGIILAFAPLFVHRSWDHAGFLLIGAILVLGQRTVANVLRMTGHARDRHFVNVHRVLSRAAWYLRAGSCILLGMLIAAKGIYRDPVRSSDDHFVKASGLRWMSLMLLAPIPWAGRVWALPFLTALVPSERACRERGRRHKPLLYVGRQLALQARRWLRGRDLVLVGDGDSSALLFLDATRRGGITVITRPRLDAALYEPAPPRPPGTTGRPRTKGVRLPNLSDVLADANPGWQTIVVPDWYGASERTVEIVSATAVLRHGGLPIVPIRWVLVRAPENRFASQALLCTDLDRAPAQIVSWFVRRWSVEVTFQEARAHLGAETQRQWSDKAIARTTPSRLALFSIVTLLASRLPTRQRTWVTTAAWYAKPRPTFVDALATVRYALWSEQTSGMSHRQCHRPKRCFVLPSSWAYVRCQAA